jgi:hypothetical protein
MAIDVDVHGRLGPDDEIERPLRYERARRRLVSREIALGRVGPEALRLRHRRLHDADARARTPGS